MTAPDEPTRPGPHLARDLLHVASGCLLGVVAAVCVYQVLGLREEPDVRRYRETRNFILSSYVEPMDADAVADLALRGMVESLDPYSRYYDRQEIAALSRDTSGVYRGLGVVFAPIDPLGQVLFALPDSPADQAGIGVGDRLLAAEGLEIASLEMSDLRSILSEDRPDPLQLRVQGVDGSEREVEVLTRELTDPTVRHARLIDPARGIGYVAITSFSQRTPEEFDAAVASLLDQGLRALIVDVRGNLGGVLQASVEVANRFLSRGRIVSHEGREETVAFEADPELARYEGLPLVILVDGESASASEVFAAALQEHRAAVIVGSPTYGKGMVQQVRALGDEQGVIKLTTSYYYTPSHRNLERTVDEAWAWGLRPDLEVLLDALETAEIHAHLGTYSPPRESIDALRAWEQRLGVELVRPHPADAQLEAAIDLLGGQRPGAWGVEGAHAP